MHLYIHVLVNLDFMTTMFYYVWLVTQLVLLAMVEQIIIVLLVQSEPIEPQVEAVVLALQDSTILVF